MTSAYTIIKKSLQTSFDPKEAAQLEVGWWEIHDDLEFIEDKTPLANAFANLFSLVFNVSPTLLTKAGKLKAEATKNHDEAESDNISEEIAKAKWLEAEKNLIEFYYKLQIAINTQK